MKYCVIKNTTTIIDGSDNADAVMIQNALNAGFVETEVEILTEEEYGARKALEPVPGQPSTTEERITELELITADLLAEKLGV